MVADVVEVVALEMASGEIEGTIEMVADGSKAMVLECCVIAGDSVVAG